MNNQEVIQYLQTSALPFPKIKFFSDKPGIYAVLFCGTSFPLKDYKPGIREIVYLGKTEKSQASRMLNTHFCSGRTGSSTIRRSLGALLRDELQLSPIPRNSVDFDAKRFSQFKLDEPSDERLSKWMQNNLSISFLEYPKSPNEIDSLETDLISQLKPIFNIDRKNTLNPYAAILKAERKATATIGFKNAGYLDRINHTKPSKEVKVKTQETIKPALNYNLASIHKYEDIWKQILPAIQKFLESPESSGSMQLPKEAFTKVGNRNNYRFNLELQNAAAINNIKGSAVARDLERVINSNKKLRSLLQGKTVKFNMDGFFTFYLRKL